ncbi:hypothetical protein FRB90_001620 [Tulasnella sp. 427]|nr:hypothetical protein FRB90_001620 [Tulasnella sp. 427]
MASPQSNINDGFGAIQNLLAVPFVSKRKREDSSNLALSTEPEDDDWHRTALPFLDDASPKLSLELDEGPECLDELHVFQVALTDLLTCPQRRGEFSKVATTVPGPQSCSIREDVYTLPETIWQRRIPQEFTRFLRPVKEIVIDTNIFLHRLHLLKDLSQQLLSRGTLAPDVSIVIPGVVYDELHGLRYRDGWQEEVLPGGPTRQVKIKDLAEAALEWVSEATNSLDNQIVRLQGSTQSRFPNSWREMWQSYTNDDSILEYIDYVVNQLVPEVALMTADKNLATKSFADGIPVFRPNETASAEEIISAFCLAATSSEEDSIEQRRSPGSGQTIVSVNTVITAAGLPQTTSKSPMDYFLTPARSSSPTKLGPSKRQREPSEVAVEADSELTPSASALPLPSQSPRAMHGANIASTNEISELRHSITEILYQDKLSKLDGVEEGEVGDVYDPVDAKLEHPTEEEGEEEEEGELRSPGPQAEHGEKARHEVGHCNVTYDDLPRELFDMLSQYRGTGLHDLLQAITPKRIFITTPNFLFFGLKLLDESVNSLRSRSLFGLDVVFAVPRLALCHIDYYKKSTNASMRARAYAADVWLRSKLVGRDRRWVVVQKDLERNPSFDWRDTWRRILARPTEEERTKGELDVCVEYAAYCANTVRSLGGRS